MNFRELKKVCKPNSEPTKRVKEGKEIKNTEKAQEVTTMQKRKVRPEMSYEELIAAWVKDHGEAMKGSAENFV